MAGDKKPQGKFVYKKLSKIRWMRSRSSDDTSVFATGSWDDNQNEVSLWSWENNQSSEPEKLANFYFAEGGDVNDLHFLSPELIATSSSDGSLAVLRLVSSDEWHISEAKKWPHLHGDEACNAVTSSGSGDQLVSVGGDGTLSQVSLGHNAPLRTYKEADSCGLTTLTFVKHDQVVVGNSRGQLKVWDLRVPEETPTNIFMLSSEHISINCLSRHPAQPHVIATGSNDGMLAFWDLRGNHSYPVTVLSGHSGPLSEVHFHQQQPDHVFSCSQSGDVWHWNGSAMSRNKDSMIGFGNPDLHYGSGCVWLNSDAAKNRVNAQALMAKQVLPVNSIDSMGSSLLVAGDNEAMYKIPAIPL